MCNPEASNCNVQWNIESYVLHAKTLETDDAQTINTSMHTQNKYTCLKKFTHKNMNIIENASRYTSTGHYRQLTTEGFCRPFEALSSVTSSRLFT